MPPDETAGRADERAEEAATHPVPSHPYLSNFYLYSENHVGLEMYEILIDTLRW